MESASTRPAVQGRARYSAACSGFARRGRHIARVSILRQIKEMLSMLNIALC